MTLPAPIAHPPRRLHWPRGFGRMTNTITITPAHLGDSATLADAKLVAKRADELLPDGWRAVAADSAAPWGELPAEVEVALDRAIDGISEWEIEWEDGAVASYVACCYGADGDEPGDCHVRVGRRADGWWIDDGDDTVRVQHGPYATREGALAAATELAAELDEGDGGNAEATRAARLEAVAGEPDPDGEYAVYWGSACREDERVVSRYATAEAAEAAAELANDRLHDSHPGGNLLCGHEVRVLVDGEWVTATEAP